MIYNNRYKHLPIKDRLWGAAIRQGNCLIWRPDSKNKRYGIILYKRKKYSPHRLAYILTKGFIQPGLYVCHTCDNPRCIEISHLWLGTARDNARDGHKKGRYPIGENHPTHVHPEVMKRGEDHPQAKLTKSKVIEIRKLSKIGINGKILAKQFNIWPSHISRIINRKNWRHI